MANRKEVSFDAEKFLDCYEDKVRAMPPITGYSCAKKSPPSQSLNKEVIENMSERDTAYLEQFVTHSQCNSVRRDGKQVFISNNFKVKIQRLVAFFSDGGSITGYVNNVLEQHFKEYEDVVNRLNDSLKL